MHPKTNNAILISTLALYFIFLASCSNKQNNRANQVNEPDSTEVTTLNDGIIYKIPTPIELFQFMQESGVVFIKEKLNNAEKAGDYLTTYKKATNFGIYAADMAYCSVFGDYQETCSTLIPLKNLHRNLIYMTHLARN
jgi:hypothetical protein